MDDQFLEAFAEVVREQVAHQTDVQLEGLGTFRLDHHKQYQQQYNDGRIVMMPPRDSIKFVADNNWIDEN